jgi:hypothetical protein
MTRLARVLLLVLLGLVLTDQSVMAQAGGIVSGIKGSNGGTAMPGDSSDHTVRMKCISGCGGSGGTSQSDNSAVTDITGVGALYDTTPPAITDGNVGLPRMNSDRQLYVECAAGCSGGTQYDQGTAGTATDKLTMAGAVRKDTAAVDAGAANGDRVVLSTDSVGRLRTTSADTTQPVSGTVTANAGTGNFTVVQATGTNLHIVCDSGCGGGTQYAEDTAHVSGDQVTMAGVVQQTADAAIAADGDRTALQVDDNGFLKVNIKAGAGSGGTALADDGDVVIGTTNGTPAMGVYESSPTACTDGDACIVGITSARAMRTAVESSALPTGAATSANQTTIIGHVDGIEGLLTTIDADTGNIATSTSATASGVGATSDAAATAGSTGSLNAKLRLATSQLDAIQTSVQLLDNAVSGAGFNITQMNGVNVTMGNGGSGTGVQRVTIASDSTGQIIALGNVAHDAADSGNPVKVGAKAIAHGTNPTAVAAADRTDLYANRAGILWTIGGHPNAITKEAQVEDADGAQTNAALVTVSAGSKIVVTRLSMSCDGSNTGPINAIVGFGTASVPARAHTGVTGVLHGFDGVPAGGGITIGDGSGILGVGADDEDLRFTMEDPAGGSCSISTTYYTIES